MNKYRSGPSRLVFTEQTVEPDTAFTRDFAADGEHGPACEAALLAAGAIKIDAPADPPAGFKSVGRVAAAQSPDKE